MAVCESVGVGWGHDDPGTFPELASAFACLRSRASTCADWRLSVPAAGRAVDGRLLDKLSRHQRTLPQPTPAHLK